MITLGWQAYSRLGSKIDSKFDVLREEMRAGFREVNRRFEEIDQRFAGVDRRFEEMITTMGSTSECVAAVETCARTRHAWYQRC